MVLKDYKYNCRHMCCLPNGYTILEVMLVTAVLSIVIMSSAPSFKVWNERTQFKQALLEVAELTKNARINALIHKTPFHVSAMGDSNNCISVSRLPSCRCNNTTSCVGDTDFTVLKLDSRQVTLKTSSKKEKNTTFTPLGTLDFGDAATLFISSEHYTGKTVISTLGRVRTCSDNHISGVAPC